MRGPAYCRRVEKDRNTVGYSCSVLLVSRFCCQDEESRPASRAQSRAASPRAQLAQEDAERRAALGKCRLRLGLFFNDVLVAKTEPAMLRPDFSAAFEQVYALRVFEQPETVKLVLSEKFGAGAWKNLAEVFVPFVWAHEQPRPARPEPMEFASELEVGS